MEGTLTPPDAALPPGEPAAAPTRPVFAAVRLAGFYVLAWTALMLALALAEVWLDPNFDSATGDALNTASVVALYIGALLVPIGAVAIARSRELIWRTSALIGAAALMAFALGTLAVLAIYERAGGA